MRILPPIVLLTLSTLLTLTAGDAFTQDVGQRRFREAVSLDTPGPVARRLGTVRDYLSAEQWGQAIDILVQVADEHGDSLIAAGPGRYVNVGRYCQQVLAGLPEAGLAVYRRRVDPQARLWFEAGRGDPDDPGLTRVVRRAFASSRGDDALWLLGERAWGRGEVSLARRYWEQMLPPAHREADRALAALRYPDTSYDRAEVLVRLVLCSLAEGNFDRADREREAIRRLHPDAEGHLAGRPGNLADILDETAAEARRWEFPPPGPTSATFAGNRQRNQVHPQAVEVGTVRWSVPLPVTELPLPKRQPALADRGPLSHFPVVFENVVLANDAERIFAWNLQTGEPAWDAERAVVYPPVPDLKLPAPNRPVGVPRYTMTLHEGRLFAKMGTPVTGRAQTELRELPSEIVCLDLADRQGALVWSASAADLVPGERDWAFEGAPLADGDRVYAVLRGGRPQTQINVACFDAETGRLLWNRRVLTTVADLPETHSLISHLLLTLGEETLFLSTDLGAIAALELRNGAPKWVATYESRRTDNAALLSDHTRRGLTPCLFHQGLVIAAPNDDDGLTAFDADTGLVLWRQTLRGGVRHLLGVAGGTLVVSGDRLWGLDLLTGDVEWRHGYEDPAGFGYGRGLLAGDHVYWPIRDELFVVDRRTGTIQRRVPLTALHGEGGGNLLIAGETLLIARPDRLTAFW